MRGRVHTVLRDALRTFSPWNITAQLGLSSGDLWPQTQLQQHALSWGDAIPELCPQSVGELPALGASHSMRSQAAPAAPCGPYPCSRSRWTVGSLRTATMHLGSRSSGLNWRRAGCRATVWKKPLKERSGVTWEAEQMVAGERTVPTGRACSPLTVTGHLRLQAPSPSDRSPASRVTHMPHKAVQPVTDPLPRLCCSGHCASPGVALGSEALCVSGRGSPSSLTAPGPPPGQRKEL